MNIVEKLTEKGLTIATAESITAGEIASTICRIAGASVCFKGGIVSYTKEMKCKLLGLSMENIERYGVYSKETVLSMANGVQKLMQSDIAVATSGVAGPNDDENVPAGTVYFCFKIKDKEFTECVRFNGDRNEIRTKATMFALEYVENKL